MLRDFTEQGAITRPIKGSGLFFQEGGSSQKDKDVVQPFLGYSSSGKASGELVYVNYGQVQDFEQLKNLSVNVTGKIAIMRYGRIFRGNMEMLGLVLKSLFRCIFTIEKMIYFDLQYNLFVFNTDVNWLPGRPLAPVVILGSHYSKSVIDIFVR